MAIPKSKITQPIPTLGMEPLPGTTPERRLESCSAGEVGEGAHDGEAVLVLEMASSMRLRLQLDRGPSLSEIAC